VTIDPSVYSTPGEKVSAEEQVNLREAAADLKESASSSALSLPPSVVAAAGGAPLSGEEKLLYEQVRNHSR